MADILTELDSSFQRYVWFDREEKYTIAAIWTAANRFLYRTELPVFSAFPMIAFMSPEPDSGKSRALDVTGQLSFNPTKRGRHTEAVLLRHVDQAHKKGTYITTVQDEIDHVFANGKDNANLIQFYNLGYERGTVVDRCDKDTDKILSTPAYCPKAFAGLRTARLDPTTKSRTIIVNMRPESKNQMRAEYVDPLELAKLRQDIDDWAALQETLDAIAAVVIPEDDIDFMINRDRQIMKPLLVIAKAVSDAWYVKALSAVKYFVESTKKDAMVPRKILIGSYTIFRNLEAADNIVTCASRRQFSSIKKQLTFMKLIKDAKTGGKFYLSRFPTSNEADTIRKVVGLKKHRKLSEGRKKVLKQQLSNVRPQSKVPLAQVLCEA